MAESKKNIAKQKKTLRALQLEVDIESGTLKSAFWKGFTLPVRLVWQGLTWLSHRPPLKQIGHALRWFFKLRVIHFIGKIIGFKYIRDSFSQLRTVTWPTFKESMRLTSAVVGFAIVFGLFVAFIDFGLDKIFKDILLK